MGQNVTIYSWEHNLYVVLETPWNIGHSYIIGLGYVDQNIKYGR